VPRSRIRGAIPPLPKYTFMAWCLVKHRDNSSLRSYRLRLGKWMLYASGSCLCPNTGFCLKRILTIKFYNITLHLVGFHRPTSPSYRKPHILHWGIQNSLNFVPEPLSKFLQTLSRAENKMGGGPWLIPCFMELKAVCERSDKYKRRIVWMRWLMIQWRGRAQKWHTHTGSDV
jgi:hypothetical protein